MEMCMKDLSWSGFEEQSLHCVHEEDCFFLLGKHNLREQVICLIFHVLTWQECCLSQNNETVR